MFKILYKIINVLGYTNQQRNAVYNIEEGRFVSNAHDNANDSAHDNAHDNAHELKHHSLQSIVVIQ
jgi:hypothetical protein